jgi:hypothetical protein
MKLALRALALTGGVCALVLVPAAAAEAAANPSGSGQPSQSCQDFQTTPTSPLLVNGFNTDGFAQAGSVYAGSPGTPSLAHAQSPAAVSQYDVACFQLSQR